MMTELVLVEGVSDVQLISYFMQNVYGWKYRNSNALGITELDKYEHIESLSKGENQLVLCGVGGNGKFASFIDKHRINAMIVEKDIASLMAVTDRDEDNDAKIGRRVNKALENVTAKSGEWISNHIIDLFGQNKLVNTFLLIIPTNENGALERVIIDALEDIPEEKGLIGEVIRFIDDLKREMVPDLNHANKYNKATVGTFFSVRDPQNAMRSFGTFISKIDWAQSESLKTLFEPFSYLGREKPIDNQIT